MKHLIIDSEQEAIIRQAVTGVTAFLKARAARRDPFGLISKAYTLQERKCANLEYQLDQPPIAPWRSVPIHHQGQFQAMAKAFLDAKSAATREVLYTQLMAFMLAQRAETKAESRLASHIKGEIPK